LICSEDIISKKEDSALNCFNSFQYLILCYITRKTAELSWNQSFLLCEEFRDFKKPNCIHWIKHSNLNFALQKFLINYLN